MTNDPTICAVSTPPGTGGIAVIRVSGPEAIPICSRLFKTGKPVIMENGEYPANTVIYGHIKGEEVLDDVLVTVFRSPHSFTGEDTVEISCHGSIYIQQRLMQWLIEGGARQALPGEFTHALL